MVRQDADTDRDELVVALVAAPGLPAELCERVAGSVSDELAERYPSVRWRLSCLTDRLVAPPADVTDVVDALRTRLLDADWDLAVSITDLPLRLRRRALTELASRTHQVGVVSVPGLGAIRLDHRLRDALLRQVARLVGDRRTDFGEKATGRTRRALAALAGDVDPRVGEGDVAFTRRLLGSHAGLIAGMVRANRPWRFAVGLYRALIAALAAVVFVLVTPEIWALTASLGGVRLAVFAVGANAAIVVTIIAAHGLWERNADPEVREQVTLFNVATGATVAIGIAVLFAALFAITLALSTVLVPPSVFARATGHPVELADYARLALFTSALATVGGALGAGLESAHAVRQAAYGYIAPDDEPDDHA
jgi:hypothetical protein